MRKSKRRQKLRNKEYVKREGRVPRKRGGRNGKEKREKKSRRGERVNREMEKRGCFGGGGGICTQLKEKGI